MIWNTLTDNIWGHGRFGKNSWPTLSSISVVAQFYPWFKLFLGVVMYDNESETKENKLRTKDKIEPQHTHESIKLLLPVNHLSMKVHTMWGSSK